MINIIRSIMLNKLYCLDFSRIFNMFSVPMGVSHGIPLLLDQGARASIEAARVAEAKISAYDLFKYERMYEDVYNPQEIGEHVTTIDHILLNCCV